MFEFMIRLSQLALPVFIFLTMVNVGMTQEPGRVARYWRDWPFYLRMLVANFVAAPLLMWAMLHFASLPIQHKAGLAVFSLVAGAPFLIRLTALSEHDLALGAATMMLLVAGTVAIVPLLLPLLLPQLSIDAGALVWTLAQQLLLPMIAGALLARFAPKVNARLQPWAARGGNIALYVVLAATIIGYLPRILPIILSGALVLGLLFILAAFGLGFVAGWGKDHLEDIGGLATAQRNTAAAMLIATHSFEDPTVFVLITLVNAIGIVLLIGLARLLKGDNVKFVVT